MRHLNTWIKGAVMALMAGGVQADTGFACRNLDLSRSLPAVEDMQGQFFRVDPDMMTFHWRSDETVAMLGDLARRLEARGTRLVLVPLPLKSLVLPDHLPQIAGDMGFDPDLAASVQDEMIRRYASAGLTVVDARRALRRAALGGARVYFQADPRLDDSGGRALAAAIAEALPDTGLPRGSFANTPEGTITLPSVMRAQLQSSCAARLPDITAPAHRLTGPEGAPQIVVISSHITGSEATHLAGFLSEASGLLARGHSLPDGSSLGALAAYLLSDAFQDAPPPLLVWDLPVWEPLMARGDQPLREVLAAASNRCTGLAAVPTDDPAVLRVDLGGTGPAPDKTLFLDTGDSDATEAGFVFTGPRGRNRTRLILRDAGAAGTGRFHMPLTALWPEGASTVEIRLDAAPQKAPIVEICE